MPHIAKRRRVAILDSGLGGLTVLTALRALTNGVDVIYFADTAHVPYGDRTLEEVAALGRRMVKHLLAQDPAFIMIASGTTCAAFDAVGWPKSPVPLIGVVEPGAKAASEVSRSGVIGVVATNATVSSGVFERAILRERPDAHVKSVGAPALVPIVESGAWAEPRAAAAVAACCGGLINAGCDTVVLGCTHFPHLSAWFAAVLGPGVQLVDPAAACAQIGAALLAKSPSEENRLTLEVSGDPNGFATNATLLSGLRHDALRQVKL